MRAPVPRAGRLGGPPDRARDRGRALHACAWLGAIVLGLAACDPSEPPASASGDGHNAAGSGAASGAPRVSASASAPDTAAIALADRLPFARDGRAADLLCALAPAGGPALPEWLDAAAPACACAQPAPSCRHVELRSDRRRALLLAPGDALRARIEPEGARFLRFAVAAAAMQPTRLAVQVTVADPASGARLAWTRGVRVVDRWVDAEIDLASLAAVDELDLEVRVAPAPDAPADSRAALALPRLIAPAGSHRGASASAAGAARPSNVVVYMIDTLRADRTSAFGYARETTPHLARLTAEGVAFDAAYSVASWTRPAIASLFTALYPGAHRIDAGSGLGRGVTTLAERFRAGGWSTWAFVANVQIFAPELGFDQGFDRFVSFPGREGGHIVPTAWVNARLRPQLDGAGDEPFLLYVHAMDPHAPYNPPTGYIGRFGDPAYGGQVLPIRTQGFQLRELDLLPADVAQVRDLYDEDVRYQDEMLGALLAWLDESGLAASTIVLVLADHGEELFERGGWEHGERLFEEQIRIPLVARIPGAPELAGRRIAEPVQIVDVMPTLLRWFGLPPSEGARGHGEDLTPLLSGRAPADGETPGRSRHAAGDAAGDTAAPERSVYCEEIRPDLGVDLAALREGRWKLIRRTPYAGDRTDLLFDLESDPGEQTDLATAEHERRAALGERLEEMRRARGRDGATAEVGVPVEVEEGTRRQLEALGYLERGGAR